MIWSYNIVRKLYISDTSQFMHARIERDAQFAFEKLFYHEAATCTRVHNHPDPCRHCWPGSANPLPPAVTQTAHIVNRFPVHNRHALVACPFGPFCGTCMKSDGSPDEKKREEKSGDNQGKESNKEFEFDSFGPWANKTELGDGTKLTDNTPPQPVLTLRELNKGNLHTVPTDTTAPNITGTRPNLWTYRDDRNLRIPSVSSVLGTLDKAVAQKRYVTSHKMW